MIGIRALAFVLATGCASANAPHADGAARAHATPTPSASTSVSPAPTLADRDGDGVPDVCDWCPGQPGIDRVDHPTGRGCPYIDCFGEIDVEIPFARNRSDPPSVTTIAGAMKTYGRVFVVGHAAADERDPTQLAEARAQSVVAALVAAGMDASALEAHAGSNVLAGSAGRVLVAPSAWCSRERAWDETSHEIRIVPRGELPSCPPREHAR